MPFDQPPSPVAPTGRPPRPWRVPLTGAAAVVALLALAWTDPAHADRMLWAALVAGVATAILSVQAFRFARRLQEAAERAAGETPIDDATDPTFRNALEALPEPALIVTAGEPDDLIGRRVVFANAAARELLRVPQEGALLVTAVRDPEVLEAVDEALFGGVARATLYETGGAQERAWRAWTRPLPVGAGPKLALLTLRDETDSRRMEKMRADFLANASHELRTPLASLSGFIETLRGHAKDDPAARDKFLDIMAAQTARMGRLVHDLMNLSRIELNEHIPPTGKVDLSMVVLDVVDATAPVAKQRHVRLEPLVLEPGAAMVAGDRDQIIQVVQNLIDNAIKYSPDGQAVVIEVEAQGQPDAAPARLNRTRLSLLSPDRADETRYALVRVGDRGPGMAREHLPRLTERFYRVEGQKSGERAGTGLGLAIVKHVMNRHRGGLTVESAPGEGATFTAYFPALEGATEPVRARERAGAPGRAA
jgi:two-component system phosphate regulon sensor histidine kinase PhoR